MTSSRRHRRKKPFDRIVLDFETEQFSSEFEQASSLGERMRLAPKLRVACIYSETTRDYRHYLPAQAAALIARLEAADEIVSYNGKQFDLLVLMRHHGLTRGAYDALNAKHTDLFEIFSKSAGFGVSLDGMARRNLGQRKMVAGRSMAALDLRSLKRAARSDVRQTFQLLRIHEAGQITFPPHYQGDVDLPLIHHHLPWDPAGYRFLDTSEMTDGQMAEYLAGTWGITNDGRLIEMSDRAAQRVREMRTREAATKKLMKRLARKRGWRRLAVARKLG